MTKIKTKTKTHRPPTKRTRVLDILRRAEERSDIDMPEHLFSELFVRMAPSSRLTVAAEIVHGASEAVVNELHDIVAGFDDSYDQADAEPDIARVRAALGIGSDDEAWNLIKTYPDLARKLAA